MKMQVNLKKINIYLKSIKKKKKIKLKNYFTIK